MPLPLRETSAVLGQGHARNLRLQPCPLSMASRLALVRCWHRGPFRSLSWPSCKLVALIVLPWSYACEHLTEAGPRPYHTVWFKNARACKYFWTLPLFFCVQNHCNKKLQEILSKTARLMPFDGLDQLRLI